VVRFLKKEMRSSKEGDRGVVNGKTVRGFKHLALENFV
jgi:hypothetical protein